MFASREHGTTHVSSPIQSLLIGQLSSGAILLYTSGTGVWTQIGKLSCVNTDTVSRTVTFYITPAGGSPAAPFISTDAQGILPGGTFNSPNEVGLVLNPGQSIWGLASGAAVVNCFLSGILTVSS